MNTNAYRLIFNRARGMLMAVAETAAAHARSPGATAAGHPPAAGLAGATPTLAKLRPAAFAALLACGAQLAVVPLAEAQIVAYKQAPASQRPTVLDAGNGVPLVNIQTPSARGVSRNTYSQFDVETRGAILNNSRTNAQTQLGGWVQGNPWLARGPARVILNEVVSGNVSQLLGYLEVAGSKAEVVIANPAGVTCNGCGFINASRATLTTGTPIISGGALEGYRVEGGSIRIEGAGMDASRVAYSDLIARAVEVNAGIWAQNLAVTAGANVVDAANTRATPIAPGGGSGPAPAFAIDVASLGGMYAGKITLVGTEAGVGVRNAGHIGASAGNLRVTADGRIENSGEIVADGNLSIAATDLTNRNLIDGRDTRIDIAGTLDNLGSARIYGDHLSISATTLNNRAEGSSAPVIAARNRLDLGVGTLANENDALLFSAGDLAIGGTLDADRHATGSATLVRNHGATIEALGALAIAAADIRNGNAELVTETIDEGSRLIQEVQPEGWGERYDVSHFPTIFNHDIERQVFVDGSTVRYFEDYTFYEYTATTTATQVVSSKPGQILAGGDATLTGNLENRDSRIVAGGTLAHSGGRLENLATPGVRTTRYSGWAQFRDWDGRDEELDFGPRVAYSPAPAVVGFDLGIATWREGSAHTGVGSAPGPAANSLYRPAVDARYLIETDPRFAGYRNWISSDYMLAQLAIDPALTQKRLGDGFHEQRLVNEQIASLTGRRFLAGYANEEEQYKALMNAGIAFAKEWQLRPGVALSAAQMAQLTSDMVWLVEKEVALPDGSRQKALVPQLYARVQAGDLGPSGSLLSGERIEVAATGSVSNLGTLAGRQLVSLTAENIRNLGGSVAGNAVRIAAQQDIAMQGGRIEAGDALDLVAGRNIDIASSTRTSEHREGGGEFGRSNIDRIATLYVRNPGGTLQLEAGGDIALLAAHLINTAPTGAGPVAASVADGAAAAAGAVSGVAASGALSAPANQTRIAAGGNLTLGTVTIEEKNHTGGKGYSNHSGSRTEVGTRIESDGDITLDAGATLAARAAEVASSEGRILAGGRDIVLEAGAASSYSDISQQKKRSGFLSSKTKSQRDSFADTTAVATTLSGESVTLLADRDIAVKGSNVVATHDATLIAGRDLKIEAATETHSESHEKKEKQGGLFSSGGASVTLGKRMNSSDQQTTASTAAKSTVGSVGGNVLLLAGETYRQVGSDVVAPQGDIDIAAKRVEIVEARETSRTVTEQKSKQSGLTVAISNPVITAAQTAEQMASAAKDTSDPRMKALAAASTALAGYNAGKAVMDGQGKTVNGVDNQIPIRNEAGDITGYRDATAADKIGGIGINVSVGSSKSKSASTQTSDTAAVSNLTAGRDITITASGAGQDSDILLQGTNATAARNLTLAAEDEILLLAARNTADQKSSNKSSSGSIGVGFMVGGTQTGFTLQAGVSGARGKADGHDLGHSNTHVTAGETLTLQSGGDTTLSGAVARGEKVVADIGGDLLIESLQDTSTYDSKQKSLGGSISLCIPPFCYGAAPVSGSVSAGNSKVKSDYRSVTEQSAIRAGDGGFDVRVEGDTDLRGGAITSTQQAIDDARNRFATGGELSTSDIENKAEYKGKSTSVSIGTSVGFDGKLTPGGTSAGFGKTEGKAESMTLAAISGIAGNKDARTGDRETGIKPIFDREKVQQEIDAQVRITQVFNALAPKAAATHASNMIASLNRQAEAESDPTKRAELEAEAKKWGPNGSYTVAMNIIIGVAGGNLESAVTKEALSWAANEMRQVMIEDSKKFKGLCDTQGNCISNMSGKSNGVNGDEKKVAGGRLILQNWCSNGRCEVDSSTISGYREDDQGRVIFNPGKDEKGNQISLSQFVDQHPEWRSPLGGHQGGEGQMELFGIQFNYAKGSFWDKLAEAYAGTHDKFNSFIWYDHLGNGKNLDGTLIGQIGNATNTTNVLLATPFALSVLLPPEVWNAISAAARLR